MKRTDEEWRKKLTPKQYPILRKKSTEAPFSGEFVDHHEDGTYTCAGCGAKLFSSHDKYDSGCGWPSYDRAIANGAVREQEDTSHGMVRNEVLCANCGGHLGHVFPDGPTDTTGTRYCINSGALNFTKQHEE